MPTPTYTEQDLKSVLKKLVHERQKVKTLESQVQPFEHEQVTNSVPSSDNHEIALLKEIVRKLGAKVKEQEEEIKKKNAHLSSQEALVAKNAESHVTEELARSEKSRQMLLEQLKDHNAKLAELETVKKEHHKSSARILELEKMLSQIRLQHPKEEIPEALSKARKLIADQERALTTLTTAHAEELSTLNKKIKDLEQEKLTLKRKLEAMGRAETIQNSTQPDHELKRKIAHLLSQNQELKSRLDLASSERTKTHMQIKELTKKIEVQEKELQKLHQELGLTRQESEQAHFQKREFEEKTILLEKTLQENEKLLREYAAIQEAHAQVTAEKKDLEEALEKETQARLELATRIQENEVQVKRLTEQHSEQHKELELLQQHLARRVKECALLSRQVEEHTESLIRASNQSELLRKTLQESEEAALKSRQELLKEQEALQQQIVKQEEETKLWKGKYENLFTSWDAQGKEIRKLRILQERFNQLEKLVGKCGEIIGTSVSGEDTSPRGDFFE